MSKLIYCNFSSVQQANTAVEDLKKAFPNKMISFLIDSTCRYAVPDFSEYAPQGIPTPVLNQLYNGQVPPKATNVIQGEGYEKNSKVTTVKMAFADDTPRDILTKIQALGGTHITSFFS